MAHEAVDLVTAEAATRGVRLACEEAQPVWGRIEPRALRTVLVNLLQNAVQFSPPRGDVRLGLHRDGAWAVVEVADQGPGLAPSEIRRVLRPFDHDDYALTRSTQGAGLGLPIAQLLCDQLGAELSLGNRAGGGLTAQVRVALAEPRPLAALAPGA